jgi:hypothetical protein
MHFLKLHQHWEISNLGPVKYALEISISCDCKHCTIHLFQLAFIDRIVKQFGQTNAHPANTPLALGIHITCPNPNEPLTSAVSEWMAHTPYHSLIGSLNYLAVTTCPDIAFIVGRLASVLDCYRPHHWDATIRVVCYLKGTCHFTLELSGTNPIKPLGFSDSDYANCPTTSRSIRGYCFSLSSSMVSWASCRQLHTMDSSCYAEYIALHDASQEVTFL